mgnify:FL=1
MRCLLLLLVLAGSSGALLAQVRFAPTSNPQERSRQTELAGLLSRSVPYLAPDTYAVWWDEVVEICQCEPKVRSDDLNWRKMVDAAQHERGAFWGGVNVMFIMGDDINDRLVIRHEMLHAVLGGDPDHRAKAWKRL